MLTLSILVKFPPEVHSDARTGPEWPEYEPWKSGAVVSKGQRQANHAHYHSPISGTRERIPLDRVRNWVQVSVRTVVLACSLYLRGHLHLHPFGPQ